MTTTAARTTTITPQPPMCKRCCYNDRVIKSGKIRQGICYDSQHWMCYKCLLRFYIRVKRKQRRQEELDKEYEERDIERRRKAILDAMCAELRVANERYEKKAAEIKRKIRSIKKRQLLSTTLQAKESEK